MDDCGPDHDKRNYKRVHAKIMDEIENGSTLVLPMATLIETGNLIAQANGDRYQYASGLADIIAKVAKEEEPWAAFTFQSKLWNEENLIKLSKEWPKLAARRRLRERVEMAVEVMEGMAVRRRLRERMEMAAKVIIMEARPRHRKEVEKKETTIRAAVIITKSANMNG